MDHMGCLKRLKKGIEKRIVSVSDFWKKSVDRRRIFKIDFRFQDSLVVKSPQTEYDSYVLSV